MPAPPETIATGAAWNRARYSAYPPLYDLLAATFAAGRRRSTGCVQDARSAEAIIAPHATCRFWGPMPNVCPIPQPRGCSPRWWSRDLKGVYPGEEAYAVTLAETPPSRAAASRPRTSARWWQPRAG